MNNEQDFELRRPWAMELKGEVARMVMTGAAAAETVYLWQQDQPYLAAGSFVVGVLTSSAMPDEHLAKPNFINRADQRTFKKLGPQPTSDWILAGEAMPSASELNPVAAEVYDLRPMPVMAIKHARQEAIEQKQALRLAEQEKRQRLLAKSEPVTARSQAPAIYRSTRAERKAAYNAEQLRKAELAAEAAAEAARAEAKAAEAAKAAARFSASERSRQRRGKTARRV